MSSKSWLNDYFKRLDENIQKNEILNERALSATVELPLSGWGRSKSLLQAMEYDKNNVQHQYPIRVGTSKPRVDFMLGKDLNRWMLDLKKPGDLCNRSKYVEQLQSYLSQEKVALGVLFNGTRAAAYVNPEHQFVIDICSKITEEDKKVVPELDLRKYPVKEAGVSGNIHELVQFFRLLRCNGTLPDIKSLSQQLSQEYIRNLRRTAAKEARREQIRKELLEIMRNPNQHVIQSIIGFSNVLKDLRAKPEELLDIWPQEFFTVETSKKEETRYKE